MPIHPNFTLCTKIHLVGDSLDGIVTDSMEFYSAEFGKAKNAARHTDEEFTAQLDYLSRFYGATVSSRDVEDTINAESDDSTDLIRAYTISIVGGDRDKVYRAASALVALARMAYGLDTCARAIYGAHGKSDCLTALFVVNVARGMADYVANGEPNYRHSEKIFVKLP